MKSKLTLISLSLLLSLSLIACSTKDQEKETTNPQTNVTDHKGTIGVTQTPDYSSKATERIDTSTVENLITAAQAVDFALEAANLTHDEVALDDDVELQRKYGVLIYEVEFETLEREYKYYIDAQSGVVVYTNNEFND